VTAGARRATRHGVDGQVDAVTVEHMSDPTEFLHLAGRSDLAAVFALLRTPSTAPPSTAPASGMPSGDWWTPLDSTGTVLGLDVDAARSVAADTTMADTTRADAQRDLDAGAVLRYVTS
jgi:hypothetical protein